MLREILVQKKPIQWEEKPEDHEQMVRRRHLLRPGSLTGESLDWNTDIRPLTGRLPQKKGKKRDTDDLSQDTTPEVFLANQPQGREK